MKKNVLITTLASLAMSQTSHAMVIHEWGTFTSLQGSNGKDQIGIYHDDEELPSFVHGLGEVRLVSQPAPSPFPSRPSPPSQPPPRRCSFKSMDCETLFQNGITQRMETPVLYFYHDEATKQTVDIDVGFPLGVVSETFPAPVTAFPSAGATDLTQGQVKFNVEVLPKGEAVSIPFVSPSNIYSHARNVNSNFVQSGIEAEKFIFYRGVGKFEGSLAVHSEPFRFGSLNVQNINPTGDQPIREMILVHTDEQGRPAVEKLDLELSSQQEMPIFRGQLEGLQQRPRESLAKVQSVLAQSLVQSGLRFDEAQAMVETWGHGYFQTPGLRILYILPPETLERILPMQVSPSPEELLRVMVGRVEIFQSKEESKVLSSIAAQGTGFDLKILGRFAEAKLRAAKARTDEAPSLYSAAVVADLETLIEKAKNQ